MILLCWLFRVRNCRTFFPATRGRALSDLVSFFYVPRPNRVSSLRSPAAGVRSSFSFSSRKPIHIAITDAAIASTGRFYRDGISDGQASGAAYVSFSEVITVRPSPVTTCRRAGWFRPSAPLCRCQTDDLWFGMSPRPAGRSAIPRLGSSRCPTGSGRSRRRRRYGTADPRCRCTGMAGATACRRR